MGAVTNCLRNIIANQADEHGLVVWFDPQRHYVDFVKELVVPNATIAIYDGSFFALRHQIEPLIGGLQPPRLVVYVPLNVEAARDALVEVEAGGVILKPGQQPATQNTSISLVARNALKSILGEKTAAAIEKQVEEGKLSLAELDALAERGEGITKGVVSIIFGTGDPRDVALGFLSSERFDAQVVNRDAVDELATLLRSAFAVDLPDAESLDKYRLRFARYVLSTDFVASVKGEVPSPLSAANTAAEAGSRKACVDLARTWRERRDTRESYVKYANLIEKELGVSRLELSLDQIVGVETFRAVETALQRLVETALVKNATEILVEIARIGQSSFWAERLADVQARWALIAVAGQVLLEAGQIAKAMKHSQGDVKALVSAYTDTDRPWCLLDSCHRRMERLFQSFEFEEGEDHRVLVQLIARARYRYQELGSKLAENFLRGFKEARFRVPGFLRQGEVFDKKVKPQIAEGKTAYVLVDALRFEMARELALSLSREFDVDVQAAIGTVPTITEIGMAALLPDYNNEPPTIVAVGEGKLALQVGGILLKDRKDRVDWLKASAGVQVFDTTLGELVPNPKKAVREGIRAADLVLVTSQEIDSLCEGDNVHLARLFMDEVLTQLGRGFRKLGELGVESIVTVADHGYLFGDELGSDMKIEAPGGHTADLHRRVWVGNGGAADPSYLRAKVSEFGLQGTLEVAVPWNFACFKVKGGAKAYFHGGLSPQELLIPVVTLKPKRSEVSGLAGEVAWELVPGSEKISTRFFSVQVLGKATGLFNPVPPKVRLEIRAKGECISRPISASYGFEDAMGDVQLKLQQKDAKVIEPAAITLMIAREPMQKTTVSIHLLNVDEANGELARLDNVEIVIAI